MIWGKNNPKCTNQLGSYPCWPCPTKKEINNEKNQSSVLHQPETPVATTISQLHSHQAQNRPICNIKRDQSSKRVTSLQTLQKVTYRRKKQSLSGRKSYNRKTFNLAMLRSRVRNHNVTIWLRTQRSDTVCFLLNQWVSETNKAFLWWRPTPLEESFQCNESKSSPDTPTDLRETIRLASRLHLTRTNVCTWELAP